jgi:hypothetical protein
MFKDAFIKLEPTQAAKLTAAVNSHLDIQFDPNNTSVMIHNLPFYEGYFLAELSRHDQYPPIIRNAVCNDKGEVHILNWTNEMIYALNKKVPITLTPESLPEYVRFFFTYVRGSHGRFLIIDTVDDIDWREEPAPAGRKALGRMIEPLTLMRIQPDGTAIFQCSIVFRDSLFQAEAHVKSDGTIEMTNEELLVEDIPVADDVLDRHG